MVLKPGKQARVILFIRFRPCSETGRARRFRWKLGAAISGSKKRIKLEPARPRAGVEKRESNPEHGLKAGHLHGVSRYFDVRASSSRALRSCSAFTRSPRRR